MKRRLKEQNGAPVFGPGRRFSQSTLGFGRFPLAEPRNRTGCRSRGQRRYGGRGAAGIGALAGLDLTRGDILGKGQFAEGDRRAFALQAAVPPAVALFLERGGNRLVKADDALIMPGRQAILSIHRIGDRLYSRHCRNIGGQCQRILPVRIGPLRFRW